MVDLSEYPLEIREVDKETVAKVKKYFSGLKTFSTADGEKHVPICAATKFSPKTYNSFVYVGPKMYFFPDNGNIKGQMSAIYRMPIRCDDIFVCTFPRSGTTMTQELVWLLANNLDYNTARSKHLIQRCAVLGSYFINPEYQRPKLEEYKQQNCNHLDILKRMVIPTVDQLDISSPRVIKCHIPLSMLPPNILDKAKIIYVARDPRDVAVSLYHLSRKLKLFEIKDNFKTFWSFFVEGLVVRGPHIEQVLEAWKHRHHPNMLFIFYEDIIKDTETAIRKICHFLNKHYSDEQINGLCEHLKFENFKNNQSVNLDFLEEFDAIVSGEQSFVRKGKSGGWRDYFDEEMTQEAQSWIDEHLLYTNFKFLQ